MAAVRLKRAYLSPTQLEVERALSDDSPSRGRRRGVFRPNTLTQDRAKSHKWSRVRSRSEGSVVLLRAEVVRGEDARMASGCGQQRGSRAADAGFRDSTESVEVMLQDMHLVDSTRPDDDKDDDDEGTESEDDVDGREEDRKISVILRKAKGTLAGVGSAKDVLRNRSTADDPDNEQVVMRRKSEYFESDREEVFLRRKSEQFGSSKPEKQKQRFSLPHSNSLSNFFDYLFRDGNSTPKRERKRMEKQESVDALTGDESSNGTMRSLLRSKLSPRTNKKISQNRNRQVYSVAGDDTSRIVDEHGRLKPPDLFLSSQSLGGSFDDYSGSDV